MDKKQSETIEDAILVGFLKAFGCEYAPVKDTFTGKVLFEVTGDVEQAMKAVYSNAPIPALWALQAVKNARQAIFSLKRKGQGYGHERNYNR